MTSNFGTWLSKTIDLVVPATDRKPIEVRLQRAISVQIQVVDERGAPISYAEGMLTDANSENPQITSNDRFLNLPSLASCLTGEDGHGTLAVGRAGLTVYVQVDHADFARSRRRQIRITKNTPPIRVVLTKGGRLHGSVVPASGRDSFWNLLLIQKSEEPKIFVQVAEDGSFDQEQIPAGDYTIDLHAGTTRGTRVGQVSIRSGGEHQLRIAADSLAPGELNIELRGLPQSAGSWTAYPTGGGLVSAQAKGRSVSIGETLRMRLPPGQYGLLLLPTHSASASTPYYHSRQTIKLGAAQKLRTTIQVEPAQTRLTIHDADGNPASHESFELQYRHPGNKSWTSHRSLRTNSLGSVLLQQLTPWPMRVVLPGTRHSTAPITWTGQKALRLHLKAR